MGKVRGRAKSEHNSKEASFRRIFFFVAFQEGGPAQSVNLSCLSASHLPAIQCACLVCFLAMFSVTVACTTPEFPATEFVTWRRMNGRGLGHALVTVGAVLRDSCPLGVGQREAETLELAFE